MRLLVFIVNQGVTVPKIHDKTSYASDRTVFFMPVHQQNKLIEKLDFFFNKARFETHVLMYSLIFSMCLIIFMLVLKTTHYFFFSQVLHSV